MIANLSLNPMNTTAFGSKRVPKMKYGQDKGKATVKILKDTYVPSKKPTAEEMEEMNELISIAKKGRK